MTFNIQNKYQMGITINGTPLASNANMLEEMVIYESVSQALPTVDLTFVNISEILETSPLTDGSKIDISIRILDPESQEEPIRLEMLLWSYQAIEVDQGMRFKMSLILSAPDFTSSRIEAIDGPSSEVFKTVAQRSRMTLLTDPSIDKQVWIRAGIRGNVWLNDVVNHSWASDKSFFVHGVTRDRELLRYNLDLRGARDPQWFFNPGIERPGDQIQANEIRYKYPRFSSSSGFLNSFFGYGRELSNFSIDEGEIQSNKPSLFTKRTSSLNLSNRLEGPQRHQSLGFGNSKNIHENYFNAYAQNMRLKSLYSVRVELMSSYFKGVKLLDRVKLQLNPDSRSEVRRTYAGDYFVEGVSTIFTPTDVLRRFSLIREGFNIETKLANDSK